jgi:NAD(P)-dependent dehydrogenase (short-subunit alcohol dehydrogenase family)
VLAVISSRAHKLVAEREERRSRRADATAMAVSKITGADLFVGNRSVAVVHHGVSPHRSAVAAVDELNAEVASAVGSLVNVVRQLLASSINSGSQPFAMLD